MFCYRWTCFKWWTSGFVFKKSCNSDHWCALGGALLALITFSLKIKRQGKSSLPFILGQSRSWFICELRHFESWNMFFYCMYLSYGFTSFFGDNLLTLCIPLKFAALSAALLWLNFQTYSLVVQLISRKFFLLIG